MPRYLWTRFRISSVHQHLIVALLLHSCCRTVSLFWCKFASCLCPMDYLLLRLELCRPQIQWLSLAGAITVRDTSTANQSTNRLFNFLGCWCPDSPRLLRRYLTMRTTFNVEDRKGFQLETLLAFSLKWKVLVLIGLYPPMKTIMRAKSVKKHSAICGGTDFMYESTII